MSNAPVFFLEAAGHFVCTLGLVALLFATVRVPLFQGVFHNSRPRAEHRVLFTLFWVGLALLARLVTVSPLFVPFFAGLYGGLLPGYCVGACLAGLLGWQGASPFTLALAVAAGVAGGTLKTPKVSWWNAILAAGLALPGLVPREPEPLRILLQEFRAEPFHLTLLLLTFSGTNFAFGRLVEYHQKMETRERSRSSDRVMRLVTPLSQILEHGLTPESAAQLVPTVREALELPGAALFVEGRLVSHSGLHALPDLEPPSGSERLQTLEHNYNQVRWVKLEDGESTVAYLALLSTPGKPFSSWLDETTEALRALLCGWLTRLRVEEQRVDLEATRFRFLQAQIRPHFLFNTLNTIASLAQGEEVRETVTNLAGFLRESFRQEQSAIDLQQELKIVERYLQIEKTRFGPKLKVVLDYPDSLPALKLPPFTLQPLVENSVQHGVGQREAGGEVRIVVKSEAQETQITVSDNGVGMTPQRLEQVWNGRTGSTTGIGVSNVRRRLESAFGSRLQLQIDSKPHDGTSISLIIQEEA